MQSAPAEQLKDAQPGPDLNSPAPQLEDHMGDPRPEDEHGEEAFVQPETPQQYWSELENLERRDKQRALAYALAGENWYPEVGKPAEARRAKIVSLLVELGDMEQARERTRAFIDKYPESPYRPLVQGVTGIHPRPGAPRP